MIKVIDKSENKIYDNNKHLIDKFAEFSTENLGFDKPVTVYFSDDQENAKNPLGQTAHYNPDTMEIHIMVTDRHLKDILRSVSHELIHHVQNCSGDLEHTTDTEAGYAQRDDRMRDMEHQAYTSGNIMNFRDFEDKFKSEKPIMNENHFKKNRLEALHNLLMEEAKASAALRAEREAKRAAPEEKEDDDDSLVGGTVNTMMTIATFSKGKELLLKTVARLRGPAAEKAVGEALKKGSKGATRRLLTKFLVEGGKGSARKFAQELIFGLAKRGYGRAILQRLLVNTAMRTFITKTLGVGLSSAGQLTGASASAGAFGAGSVAGASAATVAGFALAGAAIGTGIGYAINKGLYTGYGEEIGELATKALADPGYAMKEMDVYCKGAGALCGKVVDCTGKSGGYEYETAEGLGIADEGGRSKTLLGRDWTQLAGQFHAKDGAIMAAMMSAIANDDIENGRIKVSEDGKTAEVSKDANVSKYKDCFKANMMSSIMYNKIEKAGMGAAMAELQVILGMKKALPGGEGKGAGEGPEKGQYPDKPFSPTKVAQVAELFYQALEGIGTDAPKLQLALGALNKMGPKFTRAVEEYFRNTPKYQDFDSDGLRDALADDLFGDAETAALSAFLLADKVLGASAAASKGSGTGPTKERKCDNYPVTPGCTGNTIKSLIGIVTQATKIGQKAWKADQAGITDMYNKAVYTPEVGKLVQAALQELDPKVAKDFADKGGVLKTAKDPAVILIDRTALERNVKENKEPESLQGKRLLELNKRLMKRLK